MASVVAFGETFVDIDWNDDGCLRAQLGGSCANVVSEIAILGGKSSVITKVADDCIGKFVIKQLSDYGVSTDLIVLCEENRQRNALNVLWRLDGNTKYIFYNSNTIEYSLSKEEISFDEIYKYDIFHFGSNPVVSASAQVVDACIMNARKKGCKISYDVNARPGFWQNEKEAQKTINKYVQLSDYVKMNELEANLCIGKSLELSEIIRLLSTTYEKKVIVITCAEKGSFVLHNKMISYIEPKKVCQCDDVGAGDAYYSVFLHLLNTLVSGTMKFL